MPKIDPLQLLKFCKVLLSAGGMPTDDADLVGDLLVRGELRGYPGHGVIRIPQYLRFIQNGTYRLDTRPVVERGGKISAVVDGNHYIGQVAARFAMELAITKAQAHGVGIVCLRRAGHTGRLADYMEMATKQGLIGFGAASVGSAATTLYGGRKPIIGTNPMAFGIPARHGRDIIFDFATASMSMGEIQTRVRNQEKIPDGVMLDGAGNSTTDFQSFRGPPRGVLLPFGGYKGSNIALITEILGGILSGNGIGKTWWTNGGHGVNGLFLQAFAIEEFQSIESFYDRVDELIALVKSTPCAPGFSTILLPGESARRRQLANESRGVEIDEATWASLIALAEKLKLQDIPAPF